MTDDTGKHDSRTLDTGVTVHLRKDPGSTWAINSFDWCQPRFEGQHIGPGGLPLGPKRLIVPKPIFAQDVGWEDLKFDTEDEAYAFVAEQLRTGKVGGRKQS